MTVKELIARSKAAQEAFAFATQEQADAAARAICKVVYDNAEKLGPMAAEESRMGSEQDKIAKCRNKSALIWESLKDKKSCDIINRIEERRMIEVAKPVGVVACVTPWNYPLGQVVQKVVPAILMGCTVVLKPSQHTPLTACLLADAFDRACFPKGVFNMVSGRGSRLGDRLASHPDVDMVSFTGSTTVGIRIAQRALESVKHISLELGGKSPAVFLPSDDYSAAYPKILSSIFFNAGQTCTALSRLIVPRRDLARIESEFCELAAKLVVGDPTDPKTDIGPVSSKAQFEKIAEYVQAGIDEGARLVMGDVPTDMSRGYYVRPVVFSDVRNDMRIAREEIFGPVLCIIPYDTVEEAVSIANDTPYGLSGYVHAPTKAEAVAVAKRIHSGNVYINDAPRDVTAPFGGYKQSGIGREGGLAGLLEFTQQKAVFDRTTY